MVAFTKVRIAASRLEQTHPSKLDHDFDGDLVIYKQVHTVYPLSYTDTVET